MMFFSASSLHYASVASKCCLSHVCSLLIGQLGWVKDRDTALMSFVSYYCCITHRLPVPVCVLFPVHQTIVDNKLLCQQREQCFFFFFFVMLLKAVVRAQTPLHIQKGSLTCHFGALHAGLVSLVTGLWFLHSGWPPWAAGCRQIAVGWQISSSAPLICAVGPLA